MLCSAPRARVFLFLRRVGNQAVIGRLEFRAGKAAPGRERTCLRTAFLYISLSIGCLQNPVLLARLGADLGKGTDRRLRHDMRRKVLFHPYHVVPPVEFVPALPELPDEAIPPRCAWNCSELCVKYSSPAPSGQAMHASILQTPCKVSTCANASCSLRPRPIFWQALST